MNNIFFSFSVLVSLVFCQSNIIFAQSANVPIEHWVYRFVDRLETKGLFMRAEFHTRPFPRLAVAKMLQQAAKVEQAGQLTFEEVGLLRQLEGEFHDELAELDPGFQLEKVEPERHLYALRTDDLRFLFDGFIDQRFRFNSKKRIERGVSKSSTSWGVQARVKLHNSMVIDVEGRGFILSDIDSLSNTAFDPSAGLPVTEKALVDITVTDNVRSVLKFNLPWFDLELGRDLLEWGPGFRGNLLVSRNSNYYDLIKTTFRYKKIRLIYAHTFLNSNRSKYLVAHRLEFQPVENLLISVSESVVYGGRDVEPLYLNPFVPMIISERHLGNQDNNLMAFDGSYYLRNLRMKLYGEILFDDFSFAKDIFRSWGNKWGILLGGYWVDPFGIQNTDFRVEAVRLQPFVYSHRKLQNTYSNYNNAIGHWLGPDADDLYFGLEHRLHKNLKVGISWEQRRRAQNDFTKGARPVDGRIKFLDGVVEKNRFYGVILEWQVLRDLFVNANYNFIQTQNLHRKEGNSQKSHRLLLNIGLNY